MSALSLLAFAGAKISSAQTVHRSTGPVHGSLLIIGGGERGRDIQDVAIKLAGGRPQWVYIPTAGSDAEIAKAIPPAFIGRSGAALTVLHTRDRAVANSETFTAPLRSATAVFFDGGRQWRLVDGYAGTLTEQELRGVLDRGGLIAGTSAGATIQGSYLIRGSPLSNDILMAPATNAALGISPMLQSTSMSHNGTVRTTFPR